MASAYNCYKSFFYVSKKLSGKKKLTGGPLSIVQGRIYDFDIVGAEC